MIILGEIREYKKYKRYFFSYSNKINFGCTGWCVCSGTEKSGYCEAGITKVIQKFYRNTLFLKVKRV